MKKTHFFHYAASMLGVGMLMSFSGCKNETASQPQTEYGAMRVTLSDVETVEKFPATIKGRQDVDIYPQISGKLTAVEVTEGQRVKKGRPFSS